MNWTETGTPLPPLFSEARAAEIDAAMLRDKQQVPGLPLADGYEARRQARALRTEHFHPEGF